MFSQKLFILSFLVALGVTFALTPLMKRVAYACNLLAYPGKRKIHHKPTPYLGGIAIYGGFIAGMFIVVLSKVVFTSQFIVQITGIFIASTFIVIVGVWDDVKNIRPWMKLIGQAAAAGILFYCGLRIEVLTNPFSGQEITIPFWVSLIFSLLWFLGLMNAMNLIDGLDGLAAGIAAIVSIALMFVSIYLRNYPNVFILGVLAASCLAFLSFNFYPAGIFMGDAGSMLLGLLLASVALIGSQYKAATAAVLLAPLTALAVPVYDTFVSVVRRFAGKTSIFKADKKHIHHRLLGLGLSQRQIVVFLYLVTVYLSVFAFLFVVIPEQYALLLLLLLALGVCMGIIVLGFVEDKLRLAIRLRQGMRRRKP